MTAESFPFELDVCSHCEQVYRRPDPRRMATMAIKPVLKVRYIVEFPGHRTKHFNSRVSAYRRYAWLKIMKTYPCDASCVEEATYDDPGGYPTCSGRVHHPTRGEEHPYSRTGQRMRRDTVQYLQQRFVRWLMWHDAKLRGGDRVRAPRRKRERSIGGAT